MLMIHHRDINSLYGYIDYIGRMQVFHLGFSNGPGINY